MVFEVNESELLVPNFYRAKLGVETLFFEPETTRLFHYNYYPEADHIFTFTDIDRLGDKSVGIYRFIGKSVLAKKIFQDMRTAKFPYEEVSFPDVRDLAIHELWKNFELNADIRLKIDSALASKHLTTEEN